MTLGVFKNKIKSITISKDKCNHYYVSICYEVEIEITERDFKLKDKNKLNDCY